MTTYSHTTFQNLVDQLAQELNDSSKVHFVDDELQRNLIESFRVFNLLTGYHRTTSSFQTTSGTAFYDLTSKLAQHSAAVTDRDILGNMQYRLTETYEPVASVGISEMFTHTSLVRSIQQRRNRFIAETEHEVSRKTGVLVNPGDGIVDLNANTITIVRAVWVDENNNYTTLQRVDESSSTSMVPSWRSSTGTPKFYSVVQQPNLSVQLIPTPASTGYLHLMTVESGAELNTATPVVLGIHDDSSWGVGWGAMEDQLLRDGIGRDPERAQFCNQMYALCADMSRQLPIVLGVSINGKMIEPTSVSMLDSMRPGWEGRSLDIPTTPALLGDWLALYPVPDDEYSIEVHFVKKTPIPLVGDYIQYGKEQLSAITGWAKQLALFKEQGAQLQQGMQAGGMLIEQARTYNEQRIKRSSYLCEMYGLTNELTWSPVRRSLGEQSEEDDPRDTSSSRNSRDRNASYVNPRKRLGGR